VDSTRPQSSNRWGRAWDCPGTINDVPVPLPKRLLFVGRLRRRMRARFGGIWLADSEDVVLLFEPGRYSVAYFRRPTFLHTSWNAPSIHSTPRSRARVLVQCPSRRATRRAARRRSSTPACPPTRANFRYASRSLGGPWMLPTKRTKESWAMRQLSASLTCLSKKVPGAFDREKEIHSRPQEIHLTFLTARVELRY
jgi:hypothetical protein